MAADFSKSGNQILRGRAAPAGAREFQQAVLVRLNEQIGLATERVEIAGHDTPPRIGLDDPWHLPFAEVVFSVPTNFVAGDL